MRSVRILAVVLCVWVAGTAVAEVILSEDFSSDPLVNGWVYTSADPDHVEPALPPLAEWDSQAGNLAVTWDPTQPQSFFQKSLGVTATEESEIRIQFDLVLTKIDAADFYQIGIGLCEGDNPEFDRSGGPNFDKYFNFVEWGYFPNDGFGGPFLQPSVGTRTGGFPRANFSNPGRPLPVNQVLTFTLRYSPEAGHISMDLDIDGQPAITDSTEAPLEDGDQFFLDAFGIFFYFGGDFAPDANLVTGTVDNIVVEIIDVSTVERYHLYQ